MRGRCRKKLGGDHSHQCQLYGTSYGSVAKSQVIRVSAQAGTKAAKRASHVSPPSYYLHLYEAAGIFPISSRMRVGGSGCCVIFTPSASEIALVMAGGAQIAPPSPTPRKLTGLIGGVSRWSISMGGISTAVGTRYSMKVAVRNCQFS